MPYATLAPVAVDLIRFFDPNPPDNSELVERLFVNRQRELEAGLQYMRAAVDGISKPIVVHGPARTGKSHLLRRMLVDVRREGRYGAIVEAQVTTGLSDERKLLRSLLAQVRGTLSLIVENDGLAAYGGRRPLSRFDSLAGSYREGIDGYACRGEAARQATRQRLDAIRARGCDLVVDGQDDPALASAEIEVDAGREGARAPGTEEAERE